MPFLMDKVFDTRMAAATATKNQQCAPCPGSRRCSCSSGPSSWQPLLLQHNTTAPSRTCRRFVQAVAVLDGAHPTLYCSLDGGRRVGMGCRSGKGKACGDSLHGSTTGVARALMSMTA